MSDSFLDMDRCYLEVTIRGGSEGQPPPDYEPTFPPSFRRRDEDSRISGMRASAAQNLVFPNVFRSHSNAWSNSSSLNHEMYVVTIRMPNTGIVIAIMIQRWRRSPMTTAYGRAARN